MKPCPFCGSGNALLNQSYSWTKKKWFVYVRCELCGAQSKIYLSPEEPAETDYSNDACKAAIGAWNTRASSYEKYDEEEVRTDAN